MATFNKNRILFIMTPKLNAYGCALFECLFES